MNTEDAFERFINDQLAPEKLAHIGVATSHIKVSKITLGNVEVSMDEATRAKINEAVKKAAESMTARAYGVLPPVDTGALRPSLTYEGLMSTLDRMRSDHAAYRREQEAEEYRIRQRIQTLYNGAEFLERVDHFAEANGVEWLDAVRIVAFADMTNEAAKQWDQVLAAFASPAVQTLVNSFAQLGANILTGVDQAMKDFARANEDARLFGGDPPVNRAERRRAKHKKPIQDGDQIWKNRNSNRRRR